MDTWGWVALADRKDRAHRPAVQCFQERIQKGRAVITSDYVLDETFTLLFRRRPFSDARAFAERVMKLADQGRIWIERVNERRFRSTLELRLSFSDKPGISCTDLSSMVIMKELQITNVLTADAHFRQVGLGFQMLPD